MMDPWQITQNAVPESPEVGWFIKEVAWTKKVWVLPQCGTEINGKTRE